MEDFSNALAELQSKAENCSKSDRLLAVEYLKNLISNLEQIDKTATEKPNTLVVAEENPSVSNTDESTCDNRSLTPLKLTIRKYSRNESFFSCQECDKKYVVMSKMISHVLNTHSKSEVTCIICKGTFHSYSLLKVHECFFSRQTVFIRRLCGICGKLCLQIQDYQLHMKKEHMIELEKRFKLFGCNQCDSTFKLRSQLLVHISKRHKETINRDLIAQRIRYKLLKKSVPIQNESKEVVNGKSQWKSMKFSCVMCKRNFLSQRALDKHCLSYMHRSKAGELKLIKKFSCDMCDTSFIKMNSLQRHKTSHQIDLPHKCSLCDYRTSEKCNLAEHMRRHYQIRNYVCEFCESSFVAKRELKDHVAFKHNNSRPYECTDCGKMFKTKRILTRHSKIHSNFRPYVCACGSNFLRMTNLRRHIVGVHHDLNPSISKMQVPIDKSDMDSAVAKSKTVWFADSKCIKIKKITPSTLVQNDLPIKVIKRKIVKVKKISQKVKNKKSDDQKEEPIAPMKSPSGGSSNNNEMLSINFLIKVRAQGEEEEVDKDPKLYSTISQDYLYQSDNSDKYLHSSSSPTGIPVIHGIISNKSSLQDSSTIDDSMNICDLVASPSSYPLLETTDQSDDIQNAKQLSYDLTLKNAETLSKYKVESIMMESEISRNNLDGIWRPIDTGVNTDHSSSLVSNSIDMFPQNSGLISSFNEVFLSSVSNNCYADDSGTHWTNLSLNNTNGFNGDNSNFIITGTMSACEPLADTMPVTDSNHNGHNNGNDNFLFFNNLSQQPGDHSGHHQSFAYIESYSSAINLDHNYGSMNDNIANISYCTGNGNAVGLGVGGIGNSSFQQSIGNSHSNNSNSNNTSSHMQDLFPISYSSTSHQSDFISNSSNHHNNGNHSNGNGSLSNILFNSDQPFFTNSTTIVANNNTNNHHHHQHHSIITNQSNWLHGQHSPMNDFSNESLPPSSILDSYKLSAPSSQMTMPSSSRSMINNSIALHAPRILSPIDFLVSDSVFPSASLSSSSSMSMSISSSLRNKHEFCLSLQDDIAGSGNDLHVALADNPLISDFCSQSLHHHQYQHSSGHLCSKNFSVVNLISTGCGSHNSSSSTTKPTPDDIELLYS